MVGYCDEPERSVPPIEQLTLREGCDVTLSWDGEAFQGSTEERACGSELRGATWASSEIEVRETLLRSWDRGWDDAGEQVWGAEAGPYEFIRRQ